LTINQQVMDDLQWRGSIQNFTPGLPELLNKEKVTFYVGFDATADSLHVGSLIPLRGMQRLQKAGHHPIAVMGGGTTLIGDPSGKNRERLLLSKEEIEQNVAAIQKQMESFLDFDNSSLSNPARLVNNADWLTPLKFLDFLRDIGKLFTVNSMVVKESVRRRMESEEGITFTEFCYQLLQAFDYLELYDRYGCTLQMGGSDQWGNILAGIDLIRKRQGATAHGFVTPLLTTASGVKFGKTEAGTVWLDPKLTSPFRFYQFWLNTDDRDVLNYLKLFTDLNASEIADLEDKLSRQPEKREPQRSLAQDVTRLVHGENHLVQAERASQALFGGELDALTAADLTEIFADVPSTTLPRTQFDASGYGLNDLLVECELATSKNEARRLIEGGGIYLNNRRVTDYRLAFSSELTIEGQLLILRKGGKQYHLVKLA
jgi:tyrosyl-tRNA synthetase